MLIKVRRNVTQSNLERETNVGQSLDSSLERQRERDNLGRETEPWILGSRPGWMEKLAQFPLEKYVQIRRLSQG